MGRTITHPRTGYRFLLVASHTSTAPVDSMGYAYPPRKADNCEGCGTKRKALP